MAVDSAIVSWGQYNVGFHIELSAVNKSIINDTLSTSFNKSNLFYSTIISTSSLAACSTERDTSYKRTLWTLKNLALACLTGTLPE